MKALIVVDMQTDFLDAHSDSPQVVERVVQRIAAAKRLGRPIIVLMYYNYRSNDPRIDKALRDYRKVTILWKSYDDGSLEVENFLKRNKKRLTEFQIIGINYGYCVLSTCRGLRQRGYKAWIDKNGCNRSGQSQVEPMYLKLTR